MPGLSDRKVGVMLGKGEPHVLTLPWNLYYIEMQQLSPRGAFWEGLSWEVQSVCYPRFT